MEVSLVEQCVFHYPNPLMEGWKLYRIEYGGHAEHCIVECGIWLPPDVDPDQVELLFTIQSPRVISDGRR